MEFCFFPLNPRKFIGIYPLASCEVLLNSSEREREEGSKAKSPEPTRELFPKYPSSSQFPGLLPGFTFSTSKKLPGFRPKRSQIFQRRHSSASDGKNRIQRGFPGVGQELVLVWLKGNLGMVGRGRQSPGTASGAWASAGSRPSSRFPNIPIHARNNPGFPSLVGKTDSCFFSSSPFPFPFFSPFPFLFFISFSLFPFSCTFFPFPFNFSF